MCQRYLREYSTRLSETSSVVSDRCTVATKTAHVCFRLTMTQPLERKSRVRSLRMRLAIKMEIGSMQTFHRQQRSFIVVGEEETLNHPHRWLDDGSRSENFHYFSKSLPRRIWQESQWNKKLSMKELIISWQLSDRSMNLLPVLLGTRAPNHVFSVKPWNYRSQTSEILDCKMSEE